MPNLSAKEYALIVAKSLRSTPHATWKTLPSKPSPTVAERTRSPFSRQASQNTGISEPGVRCLAYAIPQVFPNGQARALRCPLFTQQGTRSASSSVTSFRQHLGCACALQESGMQSGNSRIKVNEKEIITRLDDGHVGVTVAICGF